MKTIKHLLISVALLALAGLSFTGCKRDAEDLSARGAFICTTFNVKLPDGIATRAISDGTGADELLFKAFDGEGKYLPELDKRVPVKDMAATVTVRLIRGENYQLVFWAQKEGIYTLGEDEAGRPILAIPNETLAVMMNNDAYDAFYGVWRGVPVAETQDVELHRPFAQINLAVPEADLEAARQNGLDLNESDPPTNAFVSQFTVSGIHDTLNLLDGDTVASEGLEEIAFDPAPVTEDNITTSDGTAYRRLGMLYVLADDESANVDVTVSVSTVRNGQIPVTVNKQVVNVPIRRNYRTNLIGNIFTVDGTFSVSIDGGFDTSDINTP